MSDNDRIEGESVASGELPAVAAVRTVPGIGSPFKVCGPADSDRRIDS